MECCAAARPGKEAKAREGSSNANEDADRPPAKLEDDQEKAKDDEIQDMLMSVKNRFISSKRFKEMCRSSFEKVDIDKSNSLDANEVYIAVLHLYLKIAGTCKGAVPPERDDIVELMARFESPRNPGALNYRNFEQFCQYLCSQIAGRVALQMFMQMALAPILGLVVCHVWEKFMLWYAKDLYNACTRYVPTDVVVTVFVGIGVSMFVPPLMKLVDYLILKEAKTLKKKIKRKVV